MADIDVVMLNGDGVYEDVDLSAPDAADEVIVAEEQQEAVVVEEQQEAPELTETEQKASDLGWRPQDSFEEEGKDFVSAEEFVKRQPLFDKIDDLKNNHKSEITELRNVINGLSENMQKAERQGYEKALTALQEERLEAVEIGDVEAFVAAENKINDMGQQVQAKEAPAQQIEAVDPEIDQFAKDNKEWFNFDSVENVSMTTEADSFYQNLAKFRSDLPTQEMLGMTKEFIKNKFPRRFQNAARAKVGAVEGNRPNRAAKAQDARLDDLSSFQRSIYEDIKKENPKYTVAEYLQVSGSSMTSL